MSTQINDLVFTDSAGQRCTLSAKALGVGGEGGVYDIIERPDKVAKIYSEKNRTEYREKKIKAMIESRRFDMKDCSWPDTILYQNGRFCGYVMKKVTALQSMIDFYVYDNRGKYPWQLFVQVARNLCAAVNNVHEIGHVIGDLNPNNVMVEPSNGMITLVDTDSYHIRSKNGEVFRCSVYVPEFVPAELQLVSPKEANFTEATDNFSLAVLIFRLLMNGVHPFSCRRNTPGSLSRFQPDNNIRFGICPFFPEFQDRLSIPILAPGLEVLPSYVHELFRRAFIDGHKEPSKRPNAEEWFNALSRLLSELVACENVRVHAYYKGLHACPWCRLNSRIKEAQQAQKKSLVKGNEEWEQYKRTHSFPGKATYTSRPPERKQYVQSKPHSNVGSVSQTSTSSVSVSSPPPQQRNYYSRQVLQPVSQTNQPLGAVTPSSGQNKPYNPLLSTLTKVGLAVLAALIIIGFIFA